MNCQDIKPLLDDYIDQTLSAPRRELVDAHCHQCDSCARLVEMMNRQAGILRSIPVPGPSTGFGRRVIDNAIHDNSPAQRQPGSANLVAKFAAAAMLSALAFWFGLAEFSGQSDTDYYQASVGDDVSTITLAIDAEDALDAVSLRVELSDNLELQGFGSKRSINWSAPLKQGVNVISLPVIGIAQGEGEITARVKLKGKQKVMHIKTRYRQPGSVYLNDYSHTG